LFGERDVAGVTDDCIEAAQAPRADEIHPGDLDGRRLAVEDPGAATERMAVQIEQHVDPVIRDEIACLFVRQTRDVAPTGRGCAKALAQRSSDGALS
jgi:hypothetical protein